MWTSLVCGVCCFLKRAFVPPPQVRGGGGLTEKFQDLLPGGGGGGVCVFYLQVMEKSSGCDIEAAFLWFTNIICPYENRLLFSAGNMGGKYLKVDIYVGFSN